jgi:hypothetical protein
MLTTHTLNIWKVFSVLFSVKLFFRELFQLFESRPIQQNSKSFFSPDNHSLLRKKSMGQCVLGRKYALFVRERGKKFLNSLSFQGEGG